jgi:hypothetical protein
VFWHDEESRDSSPDTDLDRHLERQYVQRKLAAGLSRIWQDVQTKVRLLVVAKEVGTQMKINEFLNLVKISSFFTLLHLCKMALVLKL